MSLSNDNEYPMSNPENENKKNDASNEGSLDSNTDYDQSTDYSFGWNKYSEITNGRFAMIGFLSILIIEILSKKSFFSWIDILN